MAKSVNAQINIDIGKRIRKYRRAAGLSQAELGKRIDVTFQQIQKYENATTRIPAERLIDITAALHVPVQMLVPTEFAVDSAERAQPDAYQEELEHQLLSAFRRLDDLSLKKTVIALAVCLSRT